LTESRIAVRRRVVRLAAPLLVLLLVGCASGSNDPATLDYVADESEALSLHREQIVAAIEVEPREISIGGRSQLRISLEAPGGVPPLPVWMRIHLADGLEIDTTSSDHWSCEEPTAAITGLDVVCTASADASDTALRTGAVFDLSAPRASGLHGVSVVTGFGDPDRGEASWVETLGDGSDFTMISVLSPTRRPPRVPARRAPVERWVPPPEVQTAPVTPATPTLVTAADAAPSPAFCDIFAALGSTSATVVAGPVTFSSLGSSTGASAPCGSSSTITLTAAGVTIGGTTFTDISGTITPTSLTFTTTVARGGLSLTVSGPFPDTGTVFTANAAFSVGSSRVALDGVVDYGGPKGFSVTLTASASGLGWTPLPNLSLASGGASGTFTRSGSGVAAVDTFDFTAQFGGQWSPIDGVSVSAVSVDIGNQTGDLLVSLGATVSGGISLAGLSVPLSGLKLTGTVDATTGAMTATVAVPPISLDGVVRIGAANTTFVFDPRATSSGGGNDARLSGSASFLGPLATFFSGSVDATIELFPQGYVLSAAMTSGPKTPGFTFPSPRFVYAGLTDTTVPMQYVPSGSSAGTVAIPLAHQAAVAVSSFGVPQALAGALSSLGIAILDGAGTGTVAIGLPPAEPSISIYYAAPSKPYLIGGPSSSTFVRFDDVFVSIASGETESFTIGGDVTLQVSGTALDLRSSLSIDVGATGASVDGSLELIDTSGWANAFGVSGLTVYDLLIEAGMADGLPSFGLEATASLPDTITAPLGIVSGSVITLGLDVSATTPCAVFSISPPASNPKGNVIDLDGGGLTASSAQMVIAPDGCTLGQTTYSGFSLAFTGAIRGVDVGFATTFELTPSFSLSGSGYVDAFPVGALTLEKTTVSLSISDSGFSMSIQGGFSLGSALDATGTMLLETGGGFYFSGSGTLRIGDDSADVTVKATDCSDSSCSSLTTPSFSASGDVTIQGFTFDASVDVDMDGTFDATLSIPKHSSGFSFHNSDKTVGGSGTVTYSLSVEVSNTGSDELKADVGVSLDSCTAVIIPCTNAKISFSTDIKSGSIAVAIKVEDAGFTVSANVTV
jgi:hypothetical protein